MSPLCSIDAGAWRSPTRPRLRDHNSHRIMSRSSRRLGLRFRLPRLDPPRNAPVRHRSHFLRPAPRSCWQGRPPGHKARRAPARVAREGAATPGPLLGASTPHPEDGRNTMRRGTSAWPHSSCGTLTHHQGIRATGPYLSLANVARRQPVEHFREARPRHALRSPLVPADPVQRATTDLQLP